MRTTACILLAALTAFTAGGCKNKSDATATGAGGTAGIEGTYLLTDMEWGGDKAPPEMIGKTDAERTVTITKDTIAIKGKNGGKDKMAQYKLDPSKTPAEINLTFATPDGKPDPAVGIYKLEGDTLTIVMAGPSKDGKFDPKDRPKEFKTKSDSFDMMLTMKKK